MNTSIDVTSLICPNCQTANPTTARTCVQCAAPLTAARAKQHLDQAEGEIRQGQYDRARNHLLQADTQMFALHDAERRASLLTGRAFFLQSWIYYNKSQIAEARTDSLLALQNLEGISGSELLLTRVLNQLGNIAMYERSAESADYYRRAAYIAVQAEAFANAAVSLSNLGLLQTTYGNMDEAISCYEQAIQYAERSDNINRLGDTYRSAATAYAEIGPFSRALQYIDKAILLIAQIDNPATICRITNDAGDIYLKYGNLAAAEGWLRQSLDIAQRTENKLMYVPNLSGLAEVMRQKGDHDASFNYANTANSQINIAPNQRGQAILPLIMHYITIGEHQIAHKYVQRFQEFFNTSPSDVDLLGLAKVEALLECIQGQWDVATQRFAVVHEVAAKLKYKYSLSDAIEDFAITILCHPLTTQYPEVQQHARTLLQQAAASFSEMEMPLRVARIEQLLQAGGPPPIPIRLTTSLSKYGLQ